MVEQFLLAEGTVLVVGPFFQATIRLSRGLTGIFINCAINFLYCNSLFYHEQDFYTICTVFENTFEDLLKLLQEISSLILLPDATTVVMKNYGPLPEKNREKDQLPGEDEERDAITEKNGDKGTLTDHVWRA